MGKNRDDGVRTRRGAGVRAFLARRYPRFAFGGAGTAVCGALITALAYPARAHEAYSPFNHFISELGRYGVSTTALLFNLSLVATGVLFLVFMVGVGLRIATPLGTTATISGVVTALSCGAVGLFPMNHLASHLVAANTFFYSGLLTMLLFGVAVAFDRKCTLPRGASLLGLIAAAVFALFLLSPLLFGAQDYGEAPGSLGFDPAKVHRPPVWTLALLEWAVFAAVTGWAVAVAVVSELAGRDRGDRAALLPPGGPASEREPAAR